VSFYDSIVRGESLKLVLSRDEGQTGELCDVASYYDIIALRRIQTRTDGSTTESEFGKISKSVQGKEAPTDFERGVQKFGAFLIRITVVMLSLVLRSSSALWHRKG